MNRTVTDKSGRKYWAVMPDKSEGWKEDAMIVTVPQSVAIGREDVSGLWDTKSFNENFNEPK